MDRSTHAPRPLAVFLLAAFAWLSAQILLRWLNWPLFHGHGAYGWPQPGAAQIAALVLVSLAPAALLLLLLGLALRRRPPRTGVWIAWGVILALIAVVELDMSWYALAKSHITWRDVHMFLTESWADHFGIRPGDIARFALLMAVHALALGAAAWAALRWSRRLPLSGARLARLGLAGSAILLVVGQVAALVRAEEGDKDQWVSVVQANPLAPAWWRSLADSAWLRDPALEAVDAALAQQGEVPAFPAPADPPRPADVLLVAVEGWNARLFDNRTMPFAWRHKHRCRYAPAHYSTGNATHYGVLGLLFGTPPYFYRGPETEGIAGSPFIDALNGQGYRTRRIGADLSIHRNLGRYLENFSAPAVEDKDDDANLSRALEALARPGPDFVYLHYGRTHFPYRHDPRFTVFTPEVPVDFDYFSPELEGQRLAVVNRYRNTLRELDDWLARLFAQVSPETLVVVTGDHGEEMFENGRLGHSSALNEAQTRTPLLICGAGVSPGVWAAVTSHADVMPTVFSTLGLPQPPGRRLGRDLWQQRAGAAVIAFNNHTRTPDRYRVTGAAAWLELRERDGRLRAWRAHPSVEAVLEEGPLIALAARLAGLVGAQRR